MYQADLDSPHCEFFVRKFGICHRLFCFLGNNFLCVSAGGAIQLYVLVEAHIDTPIKTNIVDHDSNPEQ